MGASLRSHLSLLHKRPPVPRVRIVTAPQRHLRADTCRQLSNVQIDGAHKRLIGVIPVAGARRAHGAQIGSPVSSGANVLDSLRLCSAKLALPFRFLQHPFPAPLRQEPYPMRPSAAQHVPQLLAQSNLPLRLENRSRRQSGPKLPH
jgi:hypothetical protein